MASDRQGRVVAVVERTNNPAQVTLTANLHDPDYVRIVCDTLHGLPRTFADLVAVTRGHGPSRSRPLHPELRPAPPRKPVVEGVPQPHNNLAAHLQLTSLNRPAVAAPNQIVTRYDPRTTLLTRAGRGPHGRKGSGAQGKEIPK